MLKGHGRGWLTGNWDDLTGPFVFPYLVTLALISVVSNTDRGRLDHILNRKKPYANMAL